MKRVYRRGLVLTSLLLIIVSYNNCSGGLGTGANSESSSLSFGEDSLKVDSSFGDAGCITLAISGYEPDRSKLYRLSDGFLMSYQGAFSRHLVDGNLDTSWGNQGYARAAELEAVFGPTVNGYLVAVDPQDRIYIRSNGVICRLNDNMTVDTTWSGVGPLPGCVYVSNITSGQNTPPVFDSNGNVWIFSTNQSLLIVDKYSPTGTRLLTSQSLGSKSYWVTGFSIGSPVVIGSKVLIGYKSQDQNRVHHANVLAVDAVTHVQENITSNVDLGSSIFADLSQGPGGRLLISAYSQSLNLWSMKALDAGFASAGFSATQLKRHAVEGLQYPQHSVMDDNGVLTAWGALARFNSLGQLVASSTPASGAYMSAVNHGAKSFAVHAEDTFYPTSPKLCRFDTP